ncbi:hypothetical protein ACFSCV_10265 [Methylopila henanensis]|uniref:Uncharacterized protein n=1 Tax=Methylopila henanensis TaxID=873516 RepID=A0ABW4K6I6_9HYPH
MNGDKRMANATRRFAASIVLSVVFIAPSGLAIAAEPVAFDVNVTLSKKAASALAAASEGIVVGASYSAEPLPSARKHAGEIGEIDLGSEQVEIPGKPGTAHVSGSKLRTDRLKWITGPILLNINVYSARKGGPDNILACDFFDGKLADVRSPITLRCALIEEKPQTEQKS